MVELKTQLQDIMGEARQVVEEVKETAAKLSQKGESILTVDKECEAGTGVR